MRFRQSSHFVSRVLGWCLKGEARQALQGERSQRRQTTLLSLQGLVCRLSPVGRRSAPLTPLEHAARNRLARYGAAKNRKTANAIRTELTSLGLVRAPRVLGLGGTRSCRAPGSWLV